MLALRVLLRNMCVCVPVFWESVTARGGVRRPCRAGAAFRTFAGVCMFGRVRAQTDQCACSVMCQCACSVMCWEVCAYMPACASACRYVHACTNLCRYEQPRVPTQQPQADKDNYAG